MNFSRMEINGKPYVSARELAVQANTLIQDLSAARDVAQGRYTSASHMEANFRGFFLSEPKFLH